MLTVFYDGACPLCMREIAFYQRRKGAERINWVDISKDGQLPPQLSREKALARFHVMDEAGHIHDGAKAFALLWQSLPAFKVIGHIAGFWPVRIILDIGYEVFLRIRPLLPRRDCDDQQK